MGYHTMEEVFEKANRIISRVHMYVQSNLLHINLSKCNFMYFKPSASRILNSIIDPSFTPIPCLLLNGRAVKQVLETKFLGVIIEENLSWRPQIDSVSRKLASCIGALYPSIASRTLSLKLSTSNYTMMLSLKKKKKNLSLI